MSIYARIVRRLGELGVAFDTLTHPEVSGCDDSVAYRSQAGWKGASSKCILFHAKGRFYLVVTTAERVLKARLFKKEFGTKDIRFAHPEELERETGCAIGSMPPFGHDAPDLPIYLDGRIFEAEHFMFNPADPTVSLRIATADLKRVYGAMPNPVKVFSEDIDGRLRFQPL